MNNSRDQRVIRNKPRAMISIRFALLMHNATKKLILNWTSFLDYHSVELDISQNDLKKLDDLPAYFQKKVY